jgi:hypothetical protein
MKHLIALFLVTLLFSCKKENEETCFNKYQWAVKISFDKDSVGVKILEDPENSVMNIYDKRGVEYRYSEFCNKENSTIILYGDTINATLNYFLNSELKHTRTVVFTDSTTVVQEIGK